jgi:predicted amidophosphoribosyltransferase
VDRVLLAQSCVLCHRPAEVVCPPCVAGLERAASLPCPLELDGCVAVFDYRAARRLVTALKNGDRRDLVGWLADHLALSTTPAPGTVVTWAPTASARRRARGYDQAELLARATARRWSLPCRSLLQRRAGPAQSGRSARERRSNPAFRAVGRAVPAALVVDDVATTGATLSAAARALRNAGTQRVVAVVGARAA